MKYKKQTKSMRSHYEDYIKRSEHNVHGRINYRGADILLSEGGPYYISDFPLEYQKGLKDTFESHIGFYEATYAIWKGEDILFWQPITFDFLHDTRHLTENARVEGRINSALELAKEMVDANQHLFETKH